MHATETMKRKRPQSHVKEDHGEHLFRASFPREWIVRRLPKDYGVDFEVEVVANEDVLGHRLWFQLKATSSLRKLADRPTGNHYISFRVDTDLLSYSFQCGFPLMLCVIDIGDEQAYWLPLRDHADIYLGLHKPKWRNQKQVNVHIPEVNSFDYQRTTDFYGLLWYAMQPALVASLARTEAQYNSLRKSGLFGSSGISDETEENPKTHGEAWILEWVPLVRQYLEAALGLPGLFPYHNRPLLLFNCECLAPHVSNAIDSCRKVVCSDVVEADKNDIRQIQRGIRSAWKIRQLCQKMFELSVLLPFKYVDPLQP